MTSPLDIIELPGQPGKYGRRVLVEKWIAAGSAPVNSAGRLYGQQKYFWDGWVARLPGFNPADNPDDETQRLAHVRFGALDIDPTPERVHRLSAAGLYRPYSYEPWHWELPNIRSYSIVRSLPTAPAPITQLGDPMSLRIIDSPFYRAAGYRVIHNGSAATSVQAGLVQDMITKGGVDYCAYDADNLLDFEVQMVWQLGGLTATDAAAKTSAMLKVIPK